MLYKNRHNTLFNKSINALEIVFIVLIYSLVIALITFRLLHGIEITDEALYIAEGYIVTHGATPYVNMWSQTSGFALLNAPFVWIYTFINSSTEGIFLYFRLISLFVKILFVLLSICIMYPIVKPKIVALWFLPLIAFIPYSIVSLSYSVWLVLLLMLTGICLIRAVLSEKAKEKKLYGISAGVSCALGILSYPITIFVGCFLLFITLTYEFFYSKYINKYDVTIRFLIGGLLTAILISLFFIIRTGEILGILNGIKVIIYDNPYHQLSKNITRESVALMLGYYRIWLKIVFVFLLIYFMPIINKKYKAILVAICALYFVLRGFFYVFYPNFSRVVLDLPIPQITSVLCRQLFFIPLLIFPYLLPKRKNKVMAFMLLLYLPSFIHTMTASLLAQNGMNRRYEFLFQGTLLIVPFIYWLIYDITKNRRFFKFYALFYSTLCSLTISAVFLLNYYGYVYRDNPISKLNYKVESGIYKGLYTTKEKGKGLEVLEKTIKLKTNHNEKILFMDNVPMSYLITDARYCAPSTWDIQLYTYGFKEDTLLRKYFERTGCTPDKIIYILTGRDKILSIDTEYYKFNDFVNSNYVLFENIEGHFPLKIYVKERQVPAYSAQNKHPDRFRLNTPTASN